MLAHLATPYIYISLVSFSGAEKVTVKQNRPVHSHMPENIRDHIFCSCIEVRTTVGLADTVDVSMRYPGASRCAQGTFSHR